MKTYNFSIPLGNSGNVLSYNIESPYNIDVNECKNLSYLRKIIHSQIVLPRFRIWKLHSDEKDDYLIPCGDILSGGSYSENYQSGQRKSLSFSLTNEDGKYTPSINGIWLGTRFRFEIGVEIPNEDLTIWFKKGIFVVKSVNANNSSEQRTVSIECTDKFGFLESNACVMPETTTIEYGVSIKQLIKDILGISLDNGSLIDGQPIVYDKAFEGRRMPTSVSQSAGSNYGELIMQIAEVLSAEVFYNDEGNLTFVPMIESIQDVNKPLIDNLVDKKGDYQSNEFKFDFSSIVNKIIVIGGTVNGHICMAYAKNDNPSSPYSIGRVGARMGAAINDSNITTDELASERAEYELRKLYIYRTSQSATVFFNPLLSVNNLISFTDSFFQLEQERFVVQSISYSIGYDGTMSIETSSLNDLPFEFN